MRLLRSLLLSSSLLACSYALQSDEQKEPEQAEESFTALLATVPKDSLHAALHDLHPAFQDGVFDDDRAATRAVLSENPELVERFVAAAKVELPRRQAASTNSSSPQISTASLSTRTVLITSGFTTITSTEVTQITNGDTTTASTTPPAVSTPTPTPSPTPIPTPTPSSSTTPPPPPPSSSSTVDSTSSNPSTVVIVETSTPGGGTLLSTAVKTATLPGQTSPADSTTMTITSPTSSPKSKPDLQTGFATSSKTFGKEIFALVAGAFGVAWLL